MKKLSLLMALAMLITVGGVYATWIYNEAPAAVGFSSIGVQLEGYDNTGSKGSISAVSDFSLDIDDMGGYVPGFVPSKQDGVVTITFTPTQFADPDIQENGLASLNYRLYAKIGTDELDVTQITYTFGGETYQIFEKFDTELKSVNLETKSFADGKFTYTISVDDVLALMTLKPGVQLETFAEYEAYQLALQNITFGIEVVEG